MTVREPRFTSLCAISVVVGPASRMIVSPAPASIMHRLDQTCTGWTKTQPHPLRRIIAIDSLQQKGPRTPFCREDEGLPDRGSPTLPAINPTSNEKSRKNN